MYCAMEIDLHGQPWNGITVVCLYEEVIDIESDQLR